MNAPHPIRTGSSERNDWKLATIVGAGGMGIAVARRLGQRHRLLLVDADAERVEAEAARLRTEGHDVHGIACDITDEASVGRLAKAAASAGPISVLAHIVGLSPSMGSAELILDVNLRSAALVERAFRPLMDAGGAAIFVSSLAAHIGEFTEAAVKQTDRPLDADLFARLEAALGEPLTSSEAYRHSKRALIRMVRRSAAAWGQRGVRLVSLSPGMIATPMGAAEFERTPAKRKLLEGSPVRREGTMLEIADAFEFLASDRASFVTGIDLLVDGGLAASLDYPESPE